MSSHEADENDAGVEVDFHDQAIGIALDVEDETILGEYIRRGIVLLDVIGAVPARVGGFFVPRFESLFGTGVFVPEFPQGFHSDDSHANLPQLLVSIKLKVPNLGTFLLIGRFSFHAQGGFALIWNWVLMSSNEKTDGWRGRKLE